MKFTQLLALGKKFRKVGMLIIGYYCCYSVTQSCLTLQPHGLQHVGLPGPYHLPEFAQVHVHCISDAIQPSHPLMPSSSSASASGTFPMSHLLASDDQQMKHQSFSEYSRLTSLKIGYQPLKLVISPSYFVFSCTLNLHIS